MVGAVQQDERPHGITPMSGSPRKARRRCWLFQTGASRRILFLCQGQESCCYAHNYVAKETMIVRSKDDVPAGRHELSRIRGRRESPISGPAKGSPGPGPALYRTGNLWARSDGRTRPHVLRGGRSMSVAWTPLARHVRLSCPFPVHGKLYKVTWTQRAADLDDELAMRKIWSGNNLAKCPLRAVSPAQGRDARGRRGTR